ncbi:MAG: DUF4184 family protein [Methylococcaceae bacterium]
MPFTLSHAAAIIPLHKALGKHVSFSALVIGSMAPDFPYFLKLFSGKFSHSIPGIFCFCLPVGIIAYVIFHLFFKRPATCLLPVSLSCRLTPTVFDRSLLPYHSFKVIGVSIVLGALTHLIWDSFTHVDTPIVQNFDIFRSVVFSIAGHHIYLFKVLQHLSSLLGLLILWLETLSWIKANPVNSACSIKSTSLSIRQRCLILGGIFLAGIIGSAIGGIPQLHAPYERFLFYSITGGIIGGSLALSAYCAGWHIYFFYRTQTSQASASKAVR